MKSSTWIVLITGAVAGTMITSAIWLFMLQVHSSKDSDESINIATEQVTYEALSSPEMYDRLKDATDKSEFTRLYLNYFLELRTNESGMHRLVTERDVKVEVVQLASQNKMENEQLINDLNYLMRKLGYTHH